MGILTLLYLAASAYRVFAFIPQIRKLLDVRNDPTAIDLHAWLSWAVISAITFVYAFFELEDTPFALTAFCNTAGHFTVFAIASYRQKALALDPTFK